MKTSTALYLSCIVSIATLAADPPAQPQVPAEASAAVTASYYGRTLNSLGDITSVDIGAKAASTSPKIPGLHGRVWPLIETATLQDKDSTSYGISTSPFFAIQYDNGLRVTADLFSATLHFPDGTQARYFMRLPENR